MLYLAVGPVVEPKVAYVFDFAIVVVVEPSVTDMAYPTGIVVEPNVTDMAYPARFVVEPSIADMTYSARFVVEPSVTYVFDFAIVVVVEPISAINFEINIAIQVHVKIVSDIFNESYAVGGECLTAKIATEI